jgi:ribosome-associated protein
MKNRGMIPHIVTVAAIVISVSLHYASAFSTGLVGYASYSRIECFTSTSIHRSSRVPAGGRVQQKILSSLQAANSVDNDENNSQTPLCDLQTFLRLCQLVESGGEAKNVIQNSQCLLNDVIETRRSKKLFPGDTVTFGDAINLDVATEVAKKGYIYKPKVKKVKPLPKVDADGNLEFGGRYRSEEWRAERKLKKIDRKRTNQGSK